MSFAELHRAHCRITILRALHESEMYSANASLLRDVLDAFAVVQTADQVEGELAWLQEQGLVTLEKVKGLTIATLTERGADIANGRATHPGIRRPSP